MSISNEIKLLQRQQLLEKPYILSEKSQNST